MRKMKKSILLTLLLAISGCSRETMIMSATMNGGHSYNPTNNTHYYNWGGGSTSSMRLLKEYDRYNAKLGRNEKCKDFMNVIQAYDGDWKYISTVCQNSNGEWHMVEKKTISKHEKKCHG